jgi:hypothetical protein
MENAHGTVDRAIGPASPSELSCRSGRGLARCSEGLAYLFAPRFLWECLTRQTVNPSPAPAASHPACGFPALGAPVLLGAKSYAYWGFRDEPEHHRSVATLCLMTGLSRAGFYR